MPQRAAKPAKFERGLVFANALAAMPEDPNIIRVMGPSKTADVEGILIQSGHTSGVQGCLLV